MRHYHVFAWLATSSLTLKRHITPQWFHQLERAAFSPSLGKRSPGGSQRERETRVQTVFLLVFFVKFLCVFSKFRMKELNNWHLKDYKNAIFEKINDYGTC